MLCRKRSSVSSSSGSAHSDSQKSRSSEAPVVVVSSAVLSYRGEGRVLEQLNMLVRRGDIYGLLGASGCGKTSLLSVLVGFFI